MLRNFIMLPKHPEIYLMIPPPIYEGTYDNGYTIQQSVVNEKYPIILRKIA